MAVKPSLSSGTYALSAVENWFGPASLSHKLSFSKVANKAPGHQVWAPNLG